MKPNVGQVLGWFCEAWRARYPHPYQPSKMEIGQVRNLIASASAEALADLPRAFANYLADLSPFVAQDIGHSLLWFCTKGNGINKYRSQAVAMGKRDATTTTAARQWLEEQDGCDARNGRPR